jgi:putative ABC transport system permease protein
LSNNITQGLSLLLAAIASIFLIVGGIGVMNIMLVSVTERTQEIGLRKAIGANSSDILWQFLIESIVLCLLGGFLGTGIGIVGIEAIASLTPFRPKVSTEAIVLSIAVSGTIGVVFGVLPARQAARLEAIVAL